MKFRFSLGPKVFGLVNDIYAILCESNDIKVDANVGPTKIRTRLHFSAIVRIVAPQSGPESTPVM